VDGIRECVSDDEELDRIIGETPCKKWLAGLVEYAKTMPAEFQSPKTLEVCQFLEDAAATLPPEIEEQINKSLALKLAKVREARKELPEGGDDERIVGVAIIGL
jgi:hypothetical protein